MAVWGNSTEQTRTYEAQELVERATLWVMRRADPARLTGKHVCTRPVEGIRIPQVMHTVAARGRDSHLRSSEVVSPKQQAFPIEEAF